MKKEPKMKGLQSMLTIGAPQAHTKQGKTAKAKPADDGKVSVKVILNGPLLAGTHTREQLIALLRAQRPDLKSPSSTVSKRMMLLQAEGKHPALIEVYKPASQRKATGGQRRRTGNPDTRLPLQDRLAKLDAWAARTTEEVSAGFKRMQAMRDKAAAEPRHRRVWP